MAASKGTRQLLSPAQRAKLFPAGTVHAYRIVATCAVVSVLGLVASPLSGSIWLITGFSWLLSLSLYVLSDLTRYRPAYVRSQNRLVSTGLHTLVGAKIFPALRAAGMLTLGLSGLTASNAMRGIPVVFTSGTGVVLLLLGTTLLIFRIVTGTEAAPRD